MTIPADPRPVDDQRTRSTAPDARSAAVPDTRVAIEFREILPATVGALAAAFERVLDGPGDADALVEYADALAGIGALAEAGEVYRRALGLRPDDVRAGVGSAVAAARAGRGADATRIAEHLQRIAPGDPRAWIASGICLAVTGRSAEALQAFERARAGGAARAGALGVFAAAMAAAEAATTDPQALPAARRWLEAAAHEPVSPTIGGFLPRLSTAAEGCGRPDLARAWRRAYGELCRAAVGGLPPLGWPARAAGKALRVACLVATPQDAARIRARVAECLGGEKVIEWSWLCLVDATDASSGGSSALAAAPASASARPAEADRASTGAPVVPTSLRSDTVIAATAWPPDAIAQSLADLDADSVVDCVGLVDARIGPALARRPGRRRLLDPASVDAGTLDCGLHDGLLGVDVPVTPDAEGGATATPRELGALWREAVAAHRAAKPAEADAAYQRLLALQPAYAPAWYMRGMLARQAGQLATAAAFLDRALRCAPAFIEARLALGALLALPGAAGAPAAAPGADVGTATRRNGGVESVLAAGLGADATGGSSESAPEPPGPSLAAKLLAARAAIARERGDRVAARSLFADACERDPRVAAHWAGLGEAEAARGALPEAIRALRNATALSPKDPDIAFNLAAALQRSGGLVGARRHYARAIALRPRFEAAFKQLGDTLLAARALDAWIENFRQFEQACPPSLPMAAYALQALPLAGDLDGVDRYLALLGSRTLPAADDQATCDALEELLYLMLFFDLAPETLRAYYDRYAAIAPRVYGAARAARIGGAPGAPGAARGTSDSADATRDAGAADADRGAADTHDAARVAGAANPPTAAEPDRRIRIGYLSADLRDHVMGRMCYEALRFHDRQRFAVHCYRMNADADAWTARFTASADQMVDISGLDDGEAAERIAGDRIDLLIDLATHTRGARPGILVHRPARVAATYVASAGALGLREVDFKLSDALCDPPENQAHLIERLLHVDEGVYPLRFPRRAEGPPLTRAELGIGDSTPTIGAFVNPLKLSRRCLGLWRVVLERVSDAVLLFSPNADEERPAVLRLCAAGGIGADRVHFVAQRGDEAANLVRYDLVDLVLDPLPFGGVNGTLEALAAGVPVVTLRGQRHGERTAASILARLGLSSTVTESESAYVELACKLLCDPDERARIAARVRAAVAAFGVEDARRYTRNLEAAYERALARPPSPSP